MGPFQSSNVNSILGKFFFFFLKMTIEVHNDGLV
jgi:hypothetical protein